MDERSEKFGTEVKDSKEREGELGLFLIRRGVCIYIFIY